MQVKDRLAAVGVGIDDHSIALCCKAEAASDVGGGRQQMAEHRPVLLFGLIERIKVLSRDYQNVRRSLRAQIVERNASIVLKNER